MELRNMTVRFGGITAIDNVSLDLERGRIVAVVGPNGSGKTTLFNSISGFVDLAEGSVRIEGRVARDVAPSRRVALGLARTFQTPRFDPDENVEHAVLCGFYPTTRVGLLSSMIRFPASRREERQLLASCHHILRDLNLFELRRAPLSELSMGQVRLVEVARAVANEPKYLLLDEPAAGLGHQEQQILAAEVRRLARSGIGVLLVEHNFNLVRELSEHVLVLDRGQVMLEGAPRDIEANQQFISLYLGNAGRAG